MGGRVREQDGVQAGEEMMDHPHEVYAALTQLSAYISRQEDRIDRLMAEIRELHGGIAYAPGMECTCEWCASPPSA